MRNGGANSSRILIIGKRHPHLRDGLVQLLQRLLGELVSLSQVFFKVGRQDKPIPVDGLHTTEKRHPFPRELAKIDVVAAAATGTLRVAGGLLGGRLETVDGALEQADGLGPPNDVPAAIPSRQPWTAAHGDENRTARFVELFGDLDTRLSRADNENRSTGQLPRILVRARVKLQYV